MKILIATLVLMTAAAFAWTCPSGQHWVQVASGTPGATVIEGIAFQCQPNTPTPTPTTPTSVTNNTNNNTNSNTNSLNQNQHQNQSQGQSQTSVSSASSSASNGGQANEQVSNYNEVRQVQSAIAPPVFPTSPCIKGYSGAAQTGVFGASLGGGKIDEGCDERATAQAYMAMGSRLAACKVMVMNKKSRKAGITLQDCMAAQKTEMPIIPTPVIPDSFVVSRPLPYLEMPTVVIAQKKKVTHKLAPKKSCPTLEK